MRRPLILVAILPWLSLRALHAQAPDVEAKIIPAGQ
jgi:hypothetical protein